MKLKFMDFSEVYGNALVNENAIVGGNAKIYDRAVVSGNNKIGGKVRVLDTVLSEKIEISGKGSIKGI